MGNTATQHLALTTIRMEHDESLNFCSRIRTGLVNNVELERIRNYTNWFKNNHLDPHFEVEEKLIFPVLGTNARVKRALANHRRIRRLLSCGCENQKVLNLLEEELEAYIRFEERILYKEIEKNANVKKFAEFEILHESLHFPDEVWEDQFWLE